jgi:hypothetical protein
MPVSETDPFSDVAFVGRLQKLLPMLGSQQPGEADAARRKLIEHLGQHRLSLLDVAARLGERAPRGASFTQGAREIGLERQLTLARQARDEQAQEVMIAGMRIRALEAELQHTSYEIARIAQMQGRSSLWTVAAWAVAGICLLVTFGPTLLRRAPSAQEASARLAPLRLQPRELDTSGTVLRIAPGEQAGVARVQDLAIRLSPNDQATIRAFLNRGEPVAVEQQLRIGVQNWLLVRTATGTGWARAGDVVRQ